MNLIIAILFGSISLVALLALFFQMRIRLLKKERQSAIDMLEHQIRLTDAYAWEVESKRYELTQALADLKKAHENSTQINLMLEDEVNRRTRALSEQNQKIIEYQFINAHQLRAPVARILGLTSLLQKNAAAENNSLLLHHLVSATHELDDIVHTIQQTLYAAEYTERQKSA